MTLCFFFLNFFSNLKLEEDMWKLKIAEGGNAWLRTLNNHVGRQVWEFDPELGSPEELAKIEKARENFHNHRFEKKHSADLLMRLQVSTFSEPFILFFFSNNALALCVPKAMAVSKKLVK